LAGTEASVLGSELLTFGWPEGTRPVLQPDGHYSGIHLYAIHTDGRLRELPLIPRVRSYISALGHGRATFLEWVLDADLRPTDPEEWLFNASGEVLRRRVLASPVAGWRQGGSAVNPDGTVSLHFSARGDGTGDGLLVRYGESGEADMVARGVGLGANGFLLGRDGRMIAFGQDQVTTLWRRTDIKLVGTDGSIEDILTVPVAGIRGSSAILAEDGTLYFVGREKYDVARLYAVQTPVPGFAPEDYGWTRGFGRNSRSDGWAR
jgi:hypothetical protein